MKSGLLSAKTNGTETAARPTSVLIVDDNEDNREILARRLARDGHNTVLATNGREALALVHDNSFDLILLDVLMPEMDGVSVLKELKANPEWREIPVIMISAVDEIHTVVHCIEIGADDYLPKPFNAVLLRARVEALLERKRLRDEEKRKAEDLKAAFAEISRQTELNETLLLNLLPGQVAAELRENGRVEPMYFQDATIVFSDFAGFTLATEQLSAEELVQTLHEYFSAFDEIIGCYGLEKLKTIGDSYMFAGGIPEPTSSHPVDAVMAAHAMIHRVAELAARPGHVDWKIRLGVHTGPVIAGVVGTRKFAFDVWGETVNFGSRMESSGAPGRINVSSTTYARVKDFFVCEPRGRVKTKEGREVDMYFVGGLAPRLLEARDQTWQSAFKRLYRRYFRNEPAVLPEFMAPAPGYSGVADKR